MRTPALATVSAALMLAAGAEMILFADDFQGPMKEGWHWIRENPEGWRSTKDGLEILVEPGNMWGGANDAKNVLVRPLPEFDGNLLEVRATLENYPTGQYEQIDLVWYFDDSHMVKIGLELVHGQLSLVMGREEGDKTKTLAIIPLDANKIDVRLTGNQSDVLGEYRTPDTGEWKLAGRCDLPVHGKPRISLQAYKGLPGVEHWAKVSDFRIADVTK